MGGSGSGRRWRMSSRNTVEGSLTIDANYLKGRGFLNPGRAISLSWWRRGEHCASIGGECNRDGITLRYRYNDESTELWVPVEWTPCRFGGRRPWLRCPVRQCGRRVAKLYNSGRYFICRRCANLAYESQNEGWGTRALYQAQKIREQIGGSPNMSLPFPPRPKGMHWKTYIRLRGKEYRLAGRANAYSALLLDKLVGPGWRTR